MAKRTDKTVAEFFEKFPKFRDYWHSKLNGYSRRMKLVHVEPPGKDGLYRLDIVTTKYGERYQIEADQEWSYYFLPPADSFREIGKWGTAEMMH